jgi:uncharacterized protein YbaP (TraB family)
MSIEALRQKMRQPGEWPLGRREIVWGIAAAALVALIGTTIVSTGPAGRASTNAHPQAADAPAAAAAAVTPAQLDAREAAAGPTGAPLLWRIKGAKATVYLFGSVHILRANMGWMDPRLYSAFDSAQEVWFEVPDPKVKAHIKPLTQKAFASQPVLFKGLTDQEKVELAQALRPLDFDYDPDRAAHLKPEVAAGVVNAIANMAMGYQFDRGADMSLLGLARTDKKPIHGFETVDEQIGFLNAISLQHPEDGTTALKRALDIYAGQLSPDGQDITTLAACWRTGDESCILRGVLTMRQTSPGEYDILLRRRNANWVPRIEAMAQGTDTVFITVGAAHLVGPDGLVAQLRAAGYTVNRIDP